jgi:spermidine synthase
MWLTDGLTSIGIEAGLGEYVARIVGLASVTAAPAALASGAVLPGLWACWGGSRGAADPLGDLTAANLFGSAAGALIVGVVALPWLGLRASYLVAAIAYIALAIVLAPESVTTRWVAPLAMLAAVVADPLRAPVTHLNGPDERLVAAHEGASGTVTVIDAAGDLELRLGSRYLLGGSRASTNQRRLGLLPLLLHPAPERVAFVGLATGATASAGPALGVGYTEAIEVVPEIVVAAREHFGKWNGGLAQRDDVRIVVDDGRRRLASSDALFDVIVSDLFVPWQAGTGSLYSRGCTRSWRGGSRQGLFCQWLPLYQLTREEFAIGVRTLLKVFPYVSLWRNDFYADRPVVGLFGRLEPAPRLDLERVAERVADLPGWAHDPLLAAPRGLLMLHAGELEPAADLLGDAPINRDDRPLIEFLAPRLTRLGPAGDKDWFVGDQLERFYALSTNGRPRHPTPSCRAASMSTGAPGGPRTLPPFRRGCRGDAAAEAGLEAEVRRLVPEVVAAADGAPEIEPADIEARRALADLHAQQAQARRRLEAMERRLGELETREQK